VSANTLLTSVVTGGANNHTTTAEEANALTTDFVTQGVVGAITLNTGSAGTGSFCVNADASPDMGVTIKAGQAYVTATPSSQNSQILRVRASSDYTTYTINANASGSTKFDWIYLSISATNANVPSADGSNVASFVTSRSSSNSTDNGSPPTYGLLLAIVTVANGASSITNSNITDKRFNTSIGAQNGSLIVTQSATGQPAVIQAAGIDANVDITVKSKGTGNINLTPASSGRVVVNGAGVAGALSVATSETTASTSFVDLATSGPAATVTIGASGLAIVIVSAYIFNSGGGETHMGYALSGANTVAAASETDSIVNTGTAANTYSFVKLLTGLTAGSTVFTAKYKVTSGTGTFRNRRISVIPL
jgi:hypothetical protein